MRPPFPVAELLSSYPTPSVSEGGGGAAIIDFVS